MSGTSVYKEDSMDQVGREFRRDVSAIFRIQGVTAASVLELPRRNTSVIGWVIIKETLTPVAGGNEIYQVLICRIWNL
jgi:hypothetical protein